VWAERVTPGQQKFLYSSVAVLTVGHLDETLFDADGNDQGWYCCKGRFSQLCFSEFKKPGSIDIEEWKAGIDYIRL
jgi:hypothetical protein